MRKIQVAPVPTALMLCLTCAPLSAQWLDYRTAGIPRTPEGKADLSAPAPKKANGQPDLSGIWLVPGLKYLINIAADLNGVPFQPCAAKRSAKMTRTISACPRASLRRLQSPLLGESSRLPA